MKYLTFANAEGETSWGAESPHGIADLGPTGSAIAPTLADAIAGGLLDDSPEIGNAPVHPRDSITYLPAILNPGKIICVGVNYRAHQEEASKADPEFPVIFTRFADTQIGHEQDALIPSETDMYDYEGEMAIVIRHRLDHVSADDAMAGVFGISLYNDLSARDWQRKSGQWIPGKNFPRSGAFGPSLVPLADVEDLGEQVLETRVNGDVRQQAPIKDMIFSIPEVLEFVTTFTTLDAGDVVVTGTPGGVGLFRTPPEFLAPGDIVEVSLPAVGVLRNTMVGA